MVISVVIPTLNEAEHLPRLLGALRADEVIVVDGGSQDTTVDVARRAGVSVLSSPRGRGAQLTLGAAAATGDVLWFLHADAVPPVGSDEALRRVPAPWGCFSVQFDSADPRLRLTALGMNRRARRTGSATGDMGIWARRDFFDTTGGFPQLASFEDLVFSERARTRAPWAVLSPPLLVSARRWETRGFTRTTLEHWGLRGAWRLGVPAERLARLYRKI